MNENWNYDDPIDEIYAIRRKISEQYGHDVNCYFDAMIARQSESESQGTAFVRLPIARVAPAMG